MMMMIIIIIIYCNNNVTKYNPWLAATLNTNKHLFSQACGYKLLTPYRRVLIEKLTVSQLVTKIPAVYGTRRVITAFTRARKLSLFWVVSIHFMPSYPTSWRFILMLSSHLCLGLPSGPFPSGFPPKSCIRLYSTPHVHVAINSLLQCDSNNCYYY
jgi:hypothetical protein